MRVPFTMKNLVAALILVLPCIGVTAKAQAQTGPSDWYVAGTGGPFGNGCMSLTEVYFGMVNKFKIQGENPPPALQNEWETPDDLVGTMRAAGVDATVVKRGDGFVLVKNGEGGGGFAIVLGENACESVLKGAQSH